VPIVTTIPAVGRRARKALACPARAKPRLPQRLVARALEAAFDGDRRFTVRLDNERIW